MPRGVATGAAIALLATLTACLGAGSAPATTTAHQALGFRNAAEVVMGTLTAPPTSTFLARIRHGKMGGVLFLGNDWLTRTKVKQITTTLQAAACTRGEPLLIAIDQEGGIVRRLSWAPPTEAPGDMKGATDAHNQAAAAALALRQSGIDIDFAPVVDTPSSPDNFLGSRAFSGSTTWNAALGKAFVRGLQQNGVAATAKHFPGLGLAGGNTDNGQITINASKAKIEPGLLPFQATIDVGIKLVMVNTAIYPQLDATRKPAAFSRKIIDGILRQQLGFKGITVTDSLTAPAPSAIPHAATKAMLAGSDLLIWGAESAAERGYATLVADAPGSSALRARLAQAAGRIRALKRWATTHGGPHCS
ncbi:MAG: beta-N-acetylhexosaminidase [Gaiellaceae bacterium]|jgi:beta-N-acetylhexosaminidase|nr:beta-N-acetylhexosaminidase [Gaiellaceae bacterium]